MSETGRPQHWDKRVSAAYLRIMGATQDQAARAVGRIARTIRLWEADPSWQDACNEASDRWLADVVNASRRSVLNQISGGDGSMGLCILERLDPRLAPAKQRIDVHKDTPDILILGGDKDTYIQALKAMAASNGSNGH